MTITGTLYLVLTPHHCYIPLAIRQRGNPRSQCVDGINSKRLTLEKGTILSPDHWQTLGWQSSISRYLRTWEGQLGLQQVLRLGITMQNPPSNLESSMLLQKVRIPFYCYVIFHYVNILLRQHRWNWGQLH